MEPKQATLEPDERATAGAWKWLLDQRDSPREPSSRPQPESDAERAFLDLYEPFLGSCVDRSIVIAHLGQSIDGFIATHAGDSYYVNGPQNLDHLHRMRALADAVVVGAGTVMADDPALTTRRVSGPHATRVILEGRRRLDDSYRVFADGAARTLLVRSDDVAGSQQHGKAEVVGVPGRDSFVDPSSLIDALARRGLRRIFVEGGGLVVSQFLASGVLDRLHLAIAPVMIGQGRRGIAAPTYPRLVDCLRPAYRLYRMGEDLLFDYDLRAAPDPESELLSDLARLR
jgi:diaminohydroxyphosphoribosylaminopyrimidine deaminase/5-amino-6-(5-phosphoribosylamino)uracil reductase